MSTGLFSDEEEGYKLDEEQKFKLKLPKTDSPTNDEDTSDLGDDFSDLGVDDLGGETNDKPFDDEPFDAGVEADEDEDPEKFIQQLAGKLGTTLRSYTNDRGEPDFSLEKFAINSVISATHTADMDEKDRKDIIKKINTSGGSENNSDSETDDDDFSDDDMSDDSIDTDTDTELDESTDSNFSEDSNFTNDPNFTNSTDDKGMWESDDFEVYNNSDIPQLKNDMFFQDIYNIYDMVTEILEECDDTIDTTLSDGHSWAVEHITTANTNIQNIYDFINSNSNLFTEVRETENYTFFQNLKTIQRLTFDILNTDIETIDEMIEGHHEWIPNLVAKSITHIRDVYDFVFDSILVNDEPMKIDSNVKVSPELQYHIDNKLSISESVFRYGSEKYISILSEVKKLYNYGLITLNENDRLMVEDFTNDKIKVNGQIKILEFIEEIDVEVLNESDKFKGKTSGSPTRDSSGGKAYKVYVAGCSPKTETNPRGIKLIRFGSGGLKAKLSDADARKRYDSRHGCSDGRHNDKCKAGYYSCRLPRYAKKLGMSGGGTWW
jgi:hypothetical protein